MIKKILTVLFPIILLFAALFSGCGFGSKVDSSYEEWAEYIGLNNNDRIKVEKYEEEDQKITVYLTPKGREGVKEFTELIEAHNEFVDNNPDYFPDGMSIMFSDGYRNGNYQPGVCFLSSYDWYSLDDNSYGNNMRINYFSSDRAVMSSYDKWQVDFSIDMPIIILDMGTNPMTTTKSTAFEFLTKFSGVQKVILDFGTVEDYAKFVGYVKEYQPDADVEVYHCREKVDL